MSSDRGEQVSPSQPDEDGIRVIRRQRGNESLHVLGLGACVLALGVAAGVWLSMRQYEGGSEPAPAVQAESASAAGAAAPVRTERTFTLRSSPSPRSLPAEAQESPEDYDLPSLDPDDIAAYIRPGDEEPTAAELIEALREAGIHEGIAAFNPPGTSPPLEGLAVPEDFELPEGYVRHHQVTDEGEPIEPILMFSPDYEYYDEQGRRVELPADLVVPEELAPPGLPIRHVRVPPP